MRGLALALAVSCVGCKTDDAMPTARPAGSGAARAARAPLPADAAARVFPALAHAQPLMAPRLAPDRASQLASWCIDALDAPTATSQVTAALAAEGWADVTARGTSRVAIGAIRGDQQISIVLGGVDRACTGVVATATLGPAGAWVPPAPLEDGERIR